MNTREIGAFFEDKCCEYLLQNGYEILQKNYTVRGGEIDIIAKKEDVISFVEVKSRKKAVFSLPREAVGIRKQKRIILAAQKYIMEKEISDMGFSFDVKEVLYTSKSERLSVEKMEHIPDAFLFAEESAVF